MNKQESIKIITDILYFLDIRKNEFADKIGYPAQKIYDILNQNNASKLNNAMINNIIDAFPQLNEDYVRSGAGSVFKADVMNEENSLDVIKKSLEYTAKSVLIQAETNKINAESFDRMTRSLEKLINLIEDRFK